MELDKIIEIAILQNAIKHDGSADSKFVISSILGQNPSFRSKAKEIIDLVNSKIKEINSLSLDKQTELLKKIDPSFFEKAEEKTERNIFAFLNIKQGETVKTAFPPGPEKYFHIGHSKAILLNYLLARQYGGKFQLRFEDTNPKLVKAEFYEIMQEDLKWLGVEWDELIYASDYISLLKEFAEKLISQDKAYVCFCDSEKMSSLRENGEACNCRNNSKEDNLKYFKEMETYAEGKASLRLKIDLKHKNTRMRDPSIFRVIDFPHPRIGSKFRNYPTYDFQNAALDGYFGITHRLRTLEFEMASELHHYIRKILGLTDTYTYEFSRFNLEGMLASGREMRELVASGEADGWDDPQLPTLRALKRRGFTKEAIMQLVVESGITKSAGSTLTWDTLIKYNKRVLNDSAKRFFCIKEPIELTIKDDTEREVILGMHPKLDLGKRIFKITGKYLIEKEDYNNFKKDQLIRLMDNLNFKIEAKSSSNIGQKISQDYLDFKNYNGEKTIIHFLPNDKSQNVDIEILMSDKKIIKALAEKTIETLMVGEIIQFERFCFCRLDSIEEEKGKRIYKFWFTH
ncbi:MAG: glutamate--tRNA ligase [archaeon]